MQPSRRTFATVALATNLAAAGCSDAPTPPPPPPGGAAAACPAGMLVELDVGDSKGHPDPLGAKAAGQARAGAILASQIPQPAHGRQKIEDGDFLLVNDRAAFVIENKDLSDGYARFGGELLVVDRVGDDGKPLGLSYYTETLTGLSNEMIDPTSVTVLKDGSDGGEAVVRVVGDLKPIPFLNESLSVLFPNHFGLHAAYDYALAPGAEALQIRIGIVNDTPEAADFGVEQPSQELIGFFQYSRSQLATDELGYADPSGKVPWVGFDAVDSGFVWRSPRGPIEFGITQSGFSLFWGPGFSVDACSQTFVDFAEVAPSEGGLDGLRATVRRLDGESEWRSVAGHVVDAAGAPVAEAWVHERGAGGQYLARVRTDAAGAFSIHAPPEEVTLVAQKRGYTHGGTAIAADATDASLAFEPHATIHVTTADSVGGGKVPVRVQVVPSVALPPTLEELGVLDEVDGRLHQEFAVTGEATLPVPPGQHRVIVSRGYEWELVDQTVDAFAGQVTDVAATMVHDVDTTGVMCGDFHIHSFNSADSNDPVIHKVAGAVADGLDIPVSSEHEWVIDFQPVVESLGVADWAFGMPSEELTTFAWGHFGVVPLEPHEHDTNNGAIDWVGHTPAQTFSLVRARTEKPALIVNHPSGTGFGAYFTMAEFDEATGKGGNDLWSDDFDAVEVFNDSDFEANRDKSVAHWFALLNAGHRVWAVGSSDSHHLRTSPVGYPRTCMWFGHDDPRKLSPSLVRDALLSGAATVSGGLFMTVAGPGGEKPGETVNTAGGKATFTITVEAPSWIGADTLEVIVNGKTVDEQALLPLGAGPSKRYVNQVDVALDAKAPRNWVVFHAKGEGDLAPLHPGRKPFAASNPVFLE